MKFEILADSIKKVNYKTGNAAKSAVNQLIESPRFEQFGELYFTDRAGKALPLGVYYRCRK